MIQKKFSAEFPSRVCPIRSFADPRILLLLVALATPSCSRIEVQTERAENQFFSEALSREARHFLGRDEFFRINLLNNPDPEIRSSCALILGQIRSVQALPWLYEALRQGDAATRAASAFAIGETEERSYLQEQSLSADPRANSELVRLLNDPSISVRTRAAEALGKTGSPSESAEILARLRRFSYQGTPAEQAFLGAAMTALVRLDDRSACPVIERFAQSEEPEIQWRALDALNRLKSRESRAVFLKRLEAPDFLVQAYAALGLGMSAGPEVAKSLVPLLPPRESSTGNRIPLFPRISALQALAKIKNPEAIPAIESAISADPVDDDHPEQQIFAAYAAEALGDIGSAEGEKVLLQLLDKSGPASNNALIALAQIHKSDPEKFYQITAGRRLDGPSEMRAWAEAMAELGGPDAVRELRRVLTEAVQRIGTWNPLALQSRSLMDLHLLPDADEMHRLMLRIFEKEAASELQTISATLSSMARIDAPATQETLGPFLDSHDGVIVRAALEAYRPAPGAKSPWMPVVRAYTNFQTSGDTVTRLEILRHLEPWMGEMAVREALSASLKDPDFSVRLISAGLLRSAGAADTLEQSAPSTLTESICHALAANRKSSTIAQVDTNRGTIEIELFRADAPLAVAGFVAMANRGDFQGKELRCMFPSPTCGPDIAARASAARVMRREINLHPFERGSVGMAFTGRDFNQGSFFISLVPQPFLDGTYTCFGRVISGMDIADRITPADRITQIRIKEIKTLFRRRY